MIYFWFNNRYLKGICLHTGNHLFIVIIYFRKCTETSIIRGMGEPLTAELDKATTNLHNSGTTPFNTLSFIRSFAYFQDFNGRRRVCQIFIHLID